MARYTARARAKNQISRGISWRAILSGVLFTFVTTLIVSGGMAAVVAFTQLTEPGVARVVYYLAMCVVALGGAYGARQASSLGWLHGGMVGLAYGLLAGIIGSLVFPGGLAALALGTRLLVAFVAGSIGGMVGVNL